MKVFWFSRLRRLPRWVLIGAICLAVGAVLAIVVLRHTLTSQPSNDEATLFFASSCREEPEKRASQATMRYALPAGFDPQPLMPYLNAGRSVAQIDTVGDTARFEGTITSESAARLIAILDAAAPPKRLVMSSGGGDSNAAKEIGDVLARRHIELEVVGLCASACAGSVLPAAPAVVLNGIVIFHGSSGACVRQLGLIGMGLQSGFDTTLQVWRQGQFDNRFWRKYPAVRHWVELSGTPSRGDPSGQPNDWLLVRPAALIGGGLRAVKGADYEQREAAIFALRKVHPDLVGSMFVRDRL